MTYKDFERDKPYRVVSGSNGTLLCGDIIWVDSVSLALNNAVARGWLNRDECDDSVFEGVVIEPALDYKITTSVNGNSRCEPVIYPSK